MVQAVPQAPANGRISFGKYLLKYGGGVLHGHAASKPIDRQPSTLADLAFLGLDDVGEDLFDLSRRPIASQCCRPRKSVVALATKRRKLVTAAVRYDQLQLLQTLQMLRRQLVGRPYRNAPKGHFFIRAERCKKTSHGRTPLPRRHRTPGGRKKPTPAQLPATSSATAHPIALDVCPQAPRSALR